MPTYVFHLYDGPAVEPLDETVTAGDLKEAQDLARLRLLLSGQFSHIEVFEEGALRLKLERDGDRRSPQPDESDPTQEH